MSGGCALKTWGVMDALSSSPKYHRAMRGASLPLEPSHAVSTRSGDTPSALMCAKYTDMWSTTSLMIALPIAWMSSHCCSMIIIRKQCRTRHRIGRNRFLIVALTSLTLVSLPTNAVWWLNGIVWVRPARNPLPRRPMVKRGRRSWLSESVHSKRQVSSVMLVRVSPSPPSPMDILTDNEKQKTLWESDWWTYALFISNERTLLRSMVDVSLTSPCRM
mmetsp:Transcript_21787/g.61979  ORF Transcript_21787/g.61979 Transcript_21787/m.61979 type:complete len:218 (-) Transcript_21787:680-1333(-)